MAERIIVSLTTWSKRIGNIPVVLDTIINQTRQPDLVVLNLAYDEMVPDSVQHYIDSNNIEINRVEDTKVYKKLIPTLKKYPDDCVISIDDDWLYPNNMIADFINIHKQHPDFPISGNTVVLFGMQCHCGCASLQKACYFGDFIDSIDNGVIQNCPSDDIVYTYFSNKAGHPYLRTSSLFYENMTPFNNEISYTQSEVRSNGIETSFDYLIQRFGDLDNLYLPYIKDQYFSDLVNDIHKKDVKREIRKASNKVKNEMLQTKSYRLGNLFVRPLSRLINIFK